MSAGVTSVFGGRDFGAGKYTPGPVGSDRRVPIANGGLESGSTRQPRMSAGSIRVMIVDDHEMVRAGVAAILAGQPGIVIAAEASSAHEAIRLFRTERPDVTLLDLTMPDMDGVEAMRTIRHEFPDGRFIVLTVHGGDDDIRRALGAGAKAYLLKSAPGPELVETVRAVHAGLHHLSRDVADRMTDYPVAAHLTPRELEVLRLLPRGLSNKEIAAQLDVSETTVKWFVKNILQKLAVTDRTAAVTTALERGILHVD
jgi:DNA-binding NarL/FixJ family response regulator